MNEEEMREKIEIAKKIAEGDEIYKKEIFSCVLNKLLNESQVMQHFSSNNSIETIDNDLSLPHESPRKIIATKIGLEETEVDKIVHFEADSIILIKKIEGKSRTDKQVKGILIIAYCFKYGLKKGDQLISSQISAACKNSGIQMDTLDNAFTSLRTRRLLIKQSKGGQNNILTPQGDEEAINLFKEQ